jgi:hypothetical protein
MKLKQHSLCILIIFMGLSTLLFAQHQIPFNIIGSGGERSANQNYILNSTAGEVLIGKFSGSANQQVTGFWYLYYHDVITNASGQEEDMPNTFKLEQNYPNPFNPSTIIKFGIPERSNVVIKIYDIIGSEVFTLVNEEMEAGWYQKEFSANGLSSGVYLLTIQAGSFVSTKKMLMVK